MLMIRLQRRGARKKPIYRLVINEKAKTTKGNVLEFLGSYNPHTKEFAAKEDRIKHWLSVGAQLSATVNNLLINKGIIQRKKVISWKPKKKKKNANTETQVDKKSVKNQKIKTEEKEAANVDIKPEKEVKVEDNKEEKNK